MKNIIIVGGGASGFFTAINIKEQRPDLKVTILEKSKTVLQKVKISGGGRCNVTHACFEPKQLVKSYPRGEKELLGAFHKFMTGDTFQWFEDRGIRLKIESDGRAFPESNSSKTIIDCFLNLAKDLNIKIKTNTNIINFEPKNNQWTLKTKNESFTCDKLIIASGSSSKIWNISSKLDIKTVSAVPSLFTFNINDPRIKDLGGISLANATVKVKNTRLEEQEPLLITHWGLSGPAILKLSAFGARIFADKNYHFEIIINWLSQDIEIIKQSLLDLKKEHSKKQILSNSPFTQIPKRFWNRIIKASDINLNIRWADISKKQIHKIANQLTASNFKVEGKSTFKEEFVTAGGIDLKEINFNSFECKHFNNLFFVGEVLNIDAITGGYNFQNAWTSGYICANHICAKNN